MDDTLPTGAAAPANRPPAREASADRGGAVIAGGRHDPFLRNLWYFAMPGQALRPGRLVAKTLLGEPLVFARGADGAPFALHRHLPAPRHPAVLRPVRRRRGGMLLPRLALRRRRALHGDPLAGRGPGVRRGAHQGADAIPAARCRAISGSSWATRPAIAAAAPAMPELPGVTAAHIQITDALRFPAMSIMRWSA